MNNSDPCRTCEIGWANMSQTHNIGWTNESFDSKLESCFDDCETLKLAQSINRARQEMRNGVRGKTHEEVFGDNSA